MQGRLKGLQEQVVAISAKVSTVFKKQWRGECRGRVKPNRLFVQALVCVDKCYHSQYTHANS